MWQFIVKWLLYSVGTLYIFVEKFRKYPNEEKDFESVYDKTQELLDASELRDTIYETLSSLGEETRTALSLREFDGLSYEEIAEIVSKAGYKPRFKRDISLAILSI